MLARTGPEDLLVGVLLPTPVAAKLLRDRAQNRLGVGGLPLCRYERCGRDELLHRLFPILRSGGFLSLWRCPRAKATRKRPAAASSRRWPAMTRPGSISVENYKFCLTQSAL